jgi:flagellar hook assembly protein FlgD
MMSKKMNDLYAHLHARLDAVGKHLKGAMAQLQSGSKETEAEIRAKLDAAKAKVAETKVDAEAARVRLQELAEAKKAEVEEQVREWKAKHQKDKLKKRAERAEKYAETCVELALASAAEAEEAILDALVARMDADNP